MSEIFETIQIMRKNLGPVTAYKYAVSQGYEGTEQEFAALMASYATVAEEASESAASAAASASAAAESARTLTIDSTLTQPGQPADAKVTGNKISEINNALELTTGTLVARFISGYFINTSGTTTTFAPVQNASFNNGGYTIMDCSIGDIFVISGLGGASGRLWCFAKNNGEVISKARVNANASDLQLITPPGAEKLVINTTVHGKCIKGEPLTLKQELLSDRLNSIVPSLLLTTICDSESGEWAGSSPVTNNIFVPITIKKSILLIGMKFLTTFTEGGDLITIIQRKSDNSIVSKTVTPVLVGTQEVNINALSSLLPGEYKIIFMTPNGSLYYPIVSPTYYLGDECIENVGSEYYSNNSRIKFTGKISYYDEVSNPSNLSTNIDNIDFFNPNVFNYEYVMPTDTSWSAEGRTITCNKSTGSRSWVKMEIDKSQLINNTFIAECDVSLDTGLFIAYIFGKKEDNSDKYIIVNSSIGNGHCKIEMDLNAMEMYNDLDLSKPVFFLLANVATPCVGVISNIRLWSAKYTIDESIAFYENINMMNTEIKSNTNAISSLKSERFLISPDGTKFIINVANDGSISGVPIIPTNTLFIGNSLLLGNGLKYGNHAFGMCASANDKDFYYYVTQSILSLKSSATFDKLFGRDFELATTISAARTWMTNELLPKLGNDVNLVIVQLGDNVYSQEQFSTFETSASELIQFIKEHAPNARVAWVAGWYTAGQRQAIVVNACSAKGAQFIDITPAKELGGSYIGAVIDYGVEDTRNYTFDTYTDDPTNHEITITFTVSNIEHTSVIPYNSYSVSGSTISITGNYGIVITSTVASHPGDNAMYKIATIITSELGLTS